MNKHPFIVIYGTNNSGKSEQVKKLTERIKSEISVNVTSLKYPIYDSNSGRILNEYLREDNPYDLKPIDAQIIYALNRTQYESELKRHLIEGPVVSEDYVATSIGWGGAAGVPIEFLEKINSHLITPDLAFLIEGVRYKDGVEMDHKHETDDDLSMRTSKIFKQISGEYNMIRVNNERSIDEIHEDIWKEVKKVL